MDLLGSEDHCKSLSQLNFSLTEEEQVLEDIVKQQVRNLCEDRFCTRSRSFKLF